MKPVVDAEGRLFGLVNLVDALCVAFALALLPLAYASLMLFRTARPHIQSVARAEPNREDRRIANGLVIRLKLKVRGDHFVPGLRAFIGDVAAIGFTFEDPTSADVIVGDVPLGTHDLVLYDGAQEVARAPRAVVMSPSPSAFVRIAGAFIHLDRPVADALKPDQRFLVDGQVAAEVIALGPVEPDRQLIDAASGRIESPIATASQRPAIVRVSCEPDPAAARCRVGGMLLGDPTVSVVDVPGSNPRLVLRIYDIAPDEAAHPALIRIRVDGAVNGMRARVRQGDRDIRGASVDDRTASIAEIGAASGDGFDLVVRAKLNRSQEGWRYKGALISPGEPFTFTAAAYVAGGSVINVVVDEH